MALAGGYAVLLGILYHSALFWLITEDWAKPDYSHAMLVPLIVLVLVYWKRERLKACMSEPSAAGFFFVAAGLALFWLGELAGEFFTLYLSLWLTVFGLCFLHLGWSKLKIILFPLVFALAMFPFPAFINNRITLSLKILSTGLGVKMMQMTGMSAHREGNVIDLGFTQLQVVDACSGLRYLFPMVVLSILVAYVYKLAVWKKILIVISSVPITLFSNSLRIALSGILAERFGVTAIEGFFHDFEGWFIFMLSLGFLMAEIKILNALFKEKPGESGKVETPVTLSEPVPVKDGFFRSGRAYAMVSVVLIVLTTGFSLAVEFREAIPMTKSFDVFPQDLGPYTGTRQTMDARFIDELDFTDYLMVDYADPSGKTVQLYVAYYESQSKGASIHSPASCLSGGGWEFKQAGVRELDLRGEASLSVNRAVIAKGSVEQIAYYWFPARGRILTNTYLMKFFNFWDALTRQRTDGALVRLITLVYPDERSADAEDRIQAFMAQAVPVLDGFLPR
ncbi:VPLPA-CTERM-specific exosortase XrtD [Desulfatiferula olefinivorans]